MKSNEKRCLLANFCRYKGKSDRCTNVCSAFILMHGESGKTGRVGLADIPTDYRGVTLKNSPARADNIEIYEFLEENYLPSFERQFIENPTPREQIKNIYLYSAETGTGKTTTACALLNEWIIRHFLLCVKQNKQPAQVPGFFLDVNEWQTDYNQLNREGVPRELKEKAGERYYMKMARAKTVPFLVLDDVGVRDATEGFRGDLHSIINHRVTNKLVTVFTSNIPIQKQMEVYDPRLFDRMRDLTVVIEFGGTSKRGKRK
jgi:DNA replication protein DnaC